MRRRPVPRVRSHKHVVDRGAVAARSTPAPALTAREIADLVGGRVEGDAGAVVRGIAPLERATGEELSFLALARYVPAFAASSAGVVLVSPDLAASAGTPRARVVVDRPQDAMLALLPRFFTPDARLPGIDPSAHIGRGTRLGSRVTIGPNVVLGEGAEVGDDTWIEAGAVVGHRSQIGAGSHLHPGVTVYADSAIGRRVILHSGVRIGSDGYGYVFRDGAHEKIPHVGRCILEDDVEIGANTTVDRGSIDDTIIGAGTKIDNLVHIGHNVHVGRRCLIMAQVGISGSARLEDGVIVAGQAGLAGHITIGAGARIGGQSGVFGDVPAGETWSGYPARPHKEALRAQAALFKLATVWRRLERLLDKRPADPLR